MRSSLSRIAVPPRLRNAFVLLAFLVAAVGCGGSDSDSTDAPSAVTEVTIQPVGNQMKYEQTEFTVPAGEEITLTFENTATSPAMEHNVVILTSTDDAVINRVGQAATGAADSEYVPEDDAILAYTSMAKPGETVSMTFTAPSEPGEYRYICTFPGHYLSMQGTMRVVAS